MSGRAVFEVAQWALLVIVGCLVWMLTYDVWSVWMVSLVATLAVTAGRGAEWQDHAQQDQKRIARKMAEMQEGRADG